MYVCRTLDKTVELGPSLACLTIPAPSLLADPSRPSARYCRSVQRERLTNSGCGM